jgi:hypothetical protein
METMTFERKWWAAIDSKRAASRPALWTGRILGGVAAALLAVDGMMKVLELEAAVSATTQLGYPADAVAGLGVTLLVCVLAYVLAPTSVLGAVLLTGYLGGAVATHVRAGSPILTHTLVPVLVAALLWGSLVLRDARLRVFVPWAGRGGA